jgi:hypothetical protein
VRKKAVFASHSRTFSLSLSLSPSLSLSLSLPLSLSLSPSLSHIRFENRQYKVGSKVKQYADSLRENIINRPERTRLETDSRPLLLIAFYPKSRVPDRGKVLQAIGALPPKNQPKPVNPFYNETDLSHVEWLRAITDHKFVLAPFGHGLDTHRVGEILMMGGIPVMRKSGISSCYDDSDNNFNGVRGSLPIVLLDSWNDLNKTRLDLEWIRISSLPASSWDYKRLFMSHWLGRIGKGNDTVI